MLSITPEKIIFEYYGEIMWVEAWGNDALRVRATTRPEMPENAWALRPQKPNSTVKVDQSKGVASIENGKIKAIVEESGKITFKNQNGKTLLEEFVRNRKQFQIMAGEIPTGFASALDLDAREFKPILGGDYALTCRFESNPDEKIYGLGQYQQTLVNLKGCELELAHRNSQASVPFAFSDQGYGFLWNNPAVGRVSLARNVTTWTALSTKIMDYWITAGDSPAEIMENYSIAAGAVPMMPDWAMGFWQCKLRYQTQEELLDVAREYKRRGVPLSVIVCDFFHWTMQGEWKFDPEYWPDPKAMVDELKSMGVELMVSIWPTVDHRSENYEEMREKGYLIRVDRGQPIAMTFQGNTIHIDPTNPGAREYLWNKAKKNYYDYGIKLFWLDEAEP
jgi:alpha-D-xyloside xylohydrolase